MTWQISLGLFFVFVVIQALWQRSYSQKSNIPESFPPAISYLLGVTPIAAVFGLLIDHHIHWSKWVVMLLVIEGVLIGLYNWIQFMATKRISVAQNQMTLQIYELVAIILGWILLKERLTSFQVVGGLLLLVGAYLAIGATKRGSIAKHPNIAGIALSAVGAICLGSGLVAEKAALQYMDIGAYFIFGFSMQTVALVAVASKDFSKKNISAIRKHDVRRSLYMGILSAIVGFFYIIALKKSNNISLISSLSALTLPLIIIASYFILHEKENRARMWLAGAIGFAGLLVSSLH